MNSQCLFKVFSQTLTLKPPINSSTSSNSARCLFCCSAKTTTTTTTNTSLFAAVKKKKKKNNNNNNLPLLIVPTDHKGDGERKLDWDDTLGFISLFQGDGGDDDDDDELSTMVKVYLPEIANRRICGSSEGWLVTVHENSEIQLLNPISRVLVHLPPLTAFPEVLGKFVSEEILVGTLVPEDRRGLCYLVYEHADPYGIYASLRFRDFFLTKVVTNTTPTTDDDANNSTTTTLLPTTVVMAIYGCSSKLAFCRLSTTGNVIVGNDDDTDEQNKWICCNDDGGNYQDVTFYKGNFYAVHPNGYVVVVKGLDSPSPFVEIIMQEPEYEDYPAYMNYLVESSSSSGGGGDLLMVMRDVETEDNYEDVNELKDFSYETIGFRVLKLDFNGPSWVEVTNLGEDCALFVGYNRSFSFSASKFPGCKGNCIYFTDNNDELFYKNAYGGHDMGVYNLEDGSIEKLYETSSQLIMPPPIWYVPN